MKPCRDVGRRKCLWRNAILEKVERTYRHQIFSTTSKIMLPNWIRSTYSSIPGSYSIRRKSCVARSKLRNRSQEDLYIRNSWSSAFYSVKPPPDSKRSPKGVKGESRKGGGGGSRVTKKKRNSVRKEREKERKRAKTWVEDTVCGTRYSVGAEKQSGIRSTRYGTATSADARGESASIGIGSE